MGNQIQWCSFKRPNAETPMFRQRSRRQRITLDDSTRSYSELVFSCRDVIIPHVSFQEGFFNRSVMTGKNWILALRDGVRLDGTWLAFAVWGRSRETDY